MYAFNAMHKGQKQNIFFKCTHINTENKNFTWNLKLNYSYVYHVKGNRYVCHIRKKFVIYSIELKTETSLRTVLIVYK